MSLTITILSLVALADETMYAEDQYWEDADGTTPAKVNGQVGRVEWNQNAEHTVAVERIEKADLGPIVKGD